MKANELRIGNIASAYKDVDYDNLVVLDEAAFENMLTFKSYERLYPVPLTEDLLLKFGWVWNEQCNSFEGPDTRMNLAKKSMGGYDMFNFILKATIRKNIQYVHQLQNLVYALTGEELTLKSPD